MLTESDVKDFMNSIKLHSKIQFVLRFRLHGMDAKKSLKRGVVLVAGNTCYTTSLAMGIPESNMRDPRLVCQNWAFYCHNLCY
jgi:hypothetical protein